MISVTNLTKRRKPSLPYKKIAEKILGEDFSLSIVLAGNSMMKKINKEFRKNNEIASTLSFPLSKTEGEIFLNINNSGKEVLFLLIHSMLHLKGLKHGKNMEQKEDLYYNEFV
ncbi:rRNA maturation RNAse YbeY [Patescibacteria group bacterium]